MDDVYIWIDGLTKKPKALTEETLKLISKPDSILIKMKLLLQYLVQ